MNELTTREARRFKHLVSNIKKNVGQAYDDMRAIHEERLYRASFSSWEEFCHKEFGMSRVHAERMIRHGSILKILDGSDFSGCENGQNPVPIGSVVKPAHTREVADLKPEKAAEVVAETVKRTKGKPTAKAVREVKGEIVGVALAGETPPGAGCPIPASAGVSDNPTELRLAIARASRGVQEAADAALPVLGQSDEYDGICDAVRRIRSLSVEWGE